MVMNSGNFWVNKFWIFFILLMLFYVHVCEFICIYLRFMNLYTGHGGTVEEENREMNSSDYYLECTDDSRIYGSDLQKNDKNNSC